MQIIGLLLAFIVLTAGFQVVERRWPSVRGQKRLRSGFFTDCVYWLFVPTVSKAFTGVVVFVAVLVAAELLGASITADDLRNRLVDRETAISQWPVAIQIVAFVLTADFIGYWSHRAFHSFGQLWRIHSVHHSSTELDWLSAVRLHPLNDALSAAITATPLLLLGFAPATVAVYLPFLTFYAILLHANVSWTLGPLGRVVVSPAFHRWHHSIEDAALDKNFGGLLTIWDRLFSTFYLPRGIQATRFGVKGDFVPQGFLSQMIYPLRSDKRRAMEQAVSA